MGITQANVDSPAFGLAIKEAVMATVATVTTSTFADVVNQPTPVLVDFGLRGAAPAASFRLSLTNLPTSSQDDFRSPNAT